MLFSFRLSTFSCSFLFLVEQYLVPRFQMHLDRAHPFRYVLRYAWYRPSPQVGGELRPRVGGDVDAAAGRASHVGPDFLRRVYLHRAGDEDARLPVAVVHLQFHRDDAPIVFQRGDADAEPFALQPCRAHEGRVPWDNPARHAHRLQQPTAKHKQSAKYA